MSQILGPVTGQELDLVRDECEQSALLTLHGYCDESSCAARQVRIEVKNDDGDVADILERRGLTCPLCGRALMFDGAFSGPRQREKDDQEARCSVNQQMYTRDHGPAVPIAGALDDRLPPTPEGWFNY